jgi:hypothetical protein
LLQDSNSFLNAKDESTSTNRDSLNNVESVYITPPKTGSSTMMIRVLGTSVPIGPQPYSLVVTGNLAMGTCQPGMAPGSPKSRQGQLYTDQSKNSGGSAGFKTSDTVILTVAFILIFGVPVSVYIMRKRDCVPDRLQRKNTEREVVTQEEIMVQAVDLPTIDPANFGRSFAGMGSSRKGIRLEDDE